ALGARQLAKVSEQEERSGNHNKANQTKISQRVRRNIKELSQPPHGPTGKLSGNDHPYGNVKPTLLFTLAARGTTGARSDVQHSSQNNGPGQHVIDVAVHAVDGIEPGEEVVHQADQIDGERNQQVDPGCGVADHAVPEVWLLLTVMGNVRLGLSAGQPTGEAAPGANRSHNREPDPVAAVWAVGVEISLQMARENPESPNPDGNVQHTVIVLVLLALNNF